MTLDDDLIKNNLRKKYVFKLIPAFSTLIPLNLGYIFKVMHWPGGNLLIMSGCAFFVAISISRLLRLKLSNPLSNMLSIISAFIILFMIIGPLFNFSFPFNPKASIFLWPCLLVFFFFNEVYHQIRYGVSIFTPKKLLAKKEER